MGDVFCGFEKITFRHINIVIDLRQNERHYLLSFLFNTYNL